MRFSGTPNNGTPFPCYSHTTPIRIPKDMGMRIVWVTLTIRGFHVLGSPWNHPWLLDGNRKELPSTSWTPNNHWWKNWLVVNKNHYRTSRDETQKSSSSFSIFCSMNVYTQKLWTWFSYWTSYFFPNFEYKWFGETVAISYLSRLGLLSMPTSPELSLHNAMRFSSEHLRMLKPWVIPAWRITRTRK